MSLPDRELPPPDRSQKLDREQLLQLLQQQRTDLKEQQADIDDYAGKLEQLHQLQEMLETQGAELNIAHQQLLEKNSELERTRAALETQQREMQDNFDVARRIVGGLYPYPCHRSGDFTLFGQTTVASDLSGDFFAILNQRPGRMAAILADVSGHGLPAAMILMMTRLLLNTFSAATVRLRDLLLLTHNELFDNIPPGSYVTFSLLDVGLQDGRVNYGIGGLYDGLVLRPGLTELLRIPTNNYALAFKRETAFEENDFQLLPGDRLLFFTDGLPETVNDGDEYLGLERIEELLQENRHLTGHGLRSLLFAEQKRFAASTPVRDDTSVMVLERDSEPIYQQQFDEPAAKLAVQLTERLAEVDWQLPDGEPASQLSEVAAHAVLNGIQACERAEREIRITLQIFRSFRQVKIRVSDNGPGFKRNSTTGLKSDSPDLEDSSGSGFTLYRQLLDEVFLNESGNEFNLIKYLKEDDYGD